MRKKRLAAALALALALGAVGYRGARAASLEARTFHPPRGPVARPADTAHLEGLRDISFVTADALTMRGWFVPSRNGSAVVLVHGSPSIRAELVPEARQLASHGFGVLLFDLPGHGESEGTVLWGEPDRHALSSAIDFASRQPGVDPARIGAFGFSMGSCIVAQVAATDRRLSAIVLAGAFTDALGQRRYEYKNFNPVTRYPVFWLDQRSGMDLETMRPIDAMPSIAPRPILFVVGSDDPTVPPAMTTELYRAAGEPKEVLTVRGGKHGNYATVPGSGYLEKLSSFFEKTLLASQSGNVIR